MTPVALVTGACGFCAKHLVRRLSRVPSLRRVGVDLQNTPPRDALLDDYVQMDLCRRDPMDKVIRRLRPSYVFHLAGLSHGPAEDIYRVNFLGSLNVLEAIRRYAPRARILLVGSAAEYGTVSPEDLPITEEHPCLPQGPYGASKYGMTLAGLEYVRRYRLKVVIARPFNILGAGMPPSLVVGAVARRAKQALQSDKRPPFVHVGNLETKRDFVAVEDIAEAYHRMVRGNHWGQVFNLCSGRARRIQDMVAMLLAHAPCPIRLKRNTALLRATDTRVVYGSCKKARRAFGFEPRTSLRDSIRAVWKHEMEGAF